MILTQKQFEEKRDELDKLATSIDLWVHTPLTSKKKERIQYLLDELQEKMYEKDCEYLELKLDYYHKVKAAFKE